MKFVLEVDMGDTAFDGKAAAELGRILRYWAGNLHHYELKPGDGRLSTMRAITKSAGGASRPASSGQTGDFDGRGRWPGAVVDALSGHASRPCFRLFRRP